MPFLLAPARRLVPGISSGPELPMSRSPSSSVPKFEGMNQLDTTGAVVSDVVAGQLDEGVAQRGPRAVAGGRLERTVAGHHVDRAGAVVGEAVAPLPEGAAAGVGRGDEGDQAVIGVVLTSNRISQPWKLSWSQ